jgi:hypothetical protein
LTIARVLCFGISAIFLYWLYLLIPIVVCHKSK